MEKEQTLFGNTVSPLFYNEVPPSLPSPHALTRVGGGKWESAGRT